MDDGSIISYFKSHKLNGTGIRNFVMYTEGARDYVSSQLAIHPEYETPGGYITCLVNGITLPKCVVCGRTIHYRSYKDGHTHCSRRCFSKDISIVEGRNNTMQERYGVSNPSQVDEFKDRRTATIRERYGVDSILRNKEFVRKQKKTMVERYGVDSWQKTDSRKKSEYSQSYQTILKWSDYVVPMFSEEEYRGYKHGEIYRWKCSKCGNEFEDRIGCHGHVKYDSRIPRCWKCYPQMTNESACEREVVDFVKSIYDGNIICHDRNVLNGIELDILVPERNVAIEFDGLFFHNELSGKDKGYHLRKTNECEKRGIRLVHIFEDEWNNKREFVEGMLELVLNQKDACEKTEKDADFQIAEIQFEESRWFFEENGILINGDIQFSCGLHSEGKLIMALAFGKSSTTCGWDLLGIAFKPHVGFCRYMNELLDFFEKNHEGIIAVNVDRRYPIDFIYESLGFNHVRNTGEHCWWCCNKRRIDGDLLSENTLPTILKNGYDKSKGIEENMTGNGWSRIYDCGSMIFMKKCGNSLRKSENGSY